MTVPPAAVIFLDHILDLATALEMVLFCRYTCEQTADYSAHTKQATLLDITCERCLWL